jgi:hypothetical protein
MAGENDLGAEIDRLYADLLRRPADKEGRANALAFLQAGNSLVERLQPDRVGTQRRCVIRRFGASAR